MPPVVAALAVPLVPLVGSALAPAVASTLIGVGGALGFSLIASALAPAPPAGQKTGIGGPLSYDSTHPRVLLLGRAKTGGSIVYRTTSDIQPDGTDGGGDNRFLDMVIALADHQCEGLFNVFVNGKRMTLEGSNNSHMGMNAAEYTVAGGDHLWIKFYDGSPGQAADDRMIDVTAGRPQNWTSDFVGTGMCYVRVTAKFTPDLWQGFPQLEFVLNGALIYNPGKDSTVVGGSGPHRFDDESTWEFDENTSVQLYALLRGFPVQGEYLYGVQGARSGEVRIEEALAAIADCNDSIALNDGGHENRYESGGEIKVDTPVGDAIQNALLASMSGRLVHTGRYWRMFAGVGQTPVVTITDDDILTSEPAEYDPKHGLDELKNAIYATYVEPEEKWDNKSIPVRYSTDDEATDGDRRLPLDMRLDYIHSGTQAQRVAEIARRVTRRQRVQSIVLPPWVLQYEPGDWIRWTSAKWGYTTKTFWIAGRELDLHLKCKLKLVEIDSTAYDWNEASDEDGEHPRDKPAGYDDSLD
jgi:hypothetical protein